MRILVTYASKHGSTEEVAEAVAERLREAGLLTHLVPAAEVEDSTATTASCWGRRSTWAASTTTRATC